VTGDLLNLGVLAIGGAVLFVGALSRARSLLELRTRLLELLALATERGIPVAPLVARAAAERRGRTRLRLQRVHARLSEGGTLAAACAAGGWALFPPHVLAAVRAAEGTAALPGALDAAARDAVAALHLRHRWLLAAAYPLLLALLFAAIFGALGEMGAASRPASAVLWVAAGAVALVLATCLALRRLCVFEGARLLAGERLLRALAPHVAARLPLPEALRRAAPACGNAAMAAGARDAAREIEAGADPSRTLPGIPLPAFARSRLALARDPERAAELHRALADECARRYRDRAERLLRWAVPAALLVLGAAATLQFAALMGFLDHVRRSVLW
jgi:type II secretory pathway component PulF